MHYLHLRKSFASPGQAYLTMRMHCCRFDSTDCHHRYRRVRLFSNCLVFQRISDTEAVADGIAAVVVGNFVVAVADVAIVPDSIALDSAGYVAGVVVAAAAVAKTADVADNRPVAGRFSAQIGQLFDSAVIRIVAAVAGMHIRMSSLRVKVTPNH